MTYRLAMTAFLGAALTLVPACKEPAAEGDPEIAEAAAAGEAEPVEAAGIEMSPDLTIAENAAAADDLSTLVDAVSSAGLAETLGGAGPYTLFAPTNAAFEAMSEDQRGALLEQGGPPLVSLLSYHLVQGVVTAEDLRNAIEAGNGSVELATLAGVPLTVGADGNRLVVTDGGGGQARIVAADAIQSNGMIHVVDAVLQPAAATGGE